MGAITLEEYKALSTKISADSEVVVSLGKSIDVSFTIWSIFARSLIFIILSKRLLKNMNKMEAECFKCVGICDNTFDFKHDLEEIVKVMNRVAHKKEQAKFPKFILRWETNILEQFEDKLENYWISSDKEVKELTHSISEKLNKHALHRTV